MKDSYIEHNDDDFEEVELLIAGQGKRFANFIIDYIVFFIFLIILGVIWGTVSPQTFPNEESVAKELLFRLIIMLLYTCFMTVIEFSCRGKTIGKMITRTRAVLSNGDQLTLKAAFIRSISRIVPFEAFSALGHPPHPWHDKWSDTVVIQER